MTDTVRRALRHDADNVEVPTLDANDVIAQAEQRLHRRRTVAAWTAVAGAAVIAVGSVLLTQGGPSSQGPQPVAPPSSSTSSDGSLDPDAARPLVYADGSTVHVGVKTVEARDPVAFIDATDDGAVYEAALDGTLWFTDGTTTSRIGTSGCTACPTTHVGVVTTGDSGSLVVWADLAGRRSAAPGEFVVYDTSRREEVARIRFDRPDREYRLVYVDEDQVWFAPDTGTRTQLFRFDVATGETQAVRPAELEQELSTRARMFVADDDDPQHNEPGFSADASFRQIGNRLTAATADGDPLSLTRTNGDEVLLRLPGGFTALGQEIGASAISLSQWLDDDHIVVWANGGGGDLPAQEGDLLECPLPDGTCRVAVPRSSRPYVAP